jgi:hypothetical protein
MIAASGVDAIARGDFLAVLGEVHPFVVTVEQSLFVDEHPEPQRLRQLLRETFPEGRLYPALAPDEAFRGALFPLGGHPDDVIVELPAGGRASVPRPRTSAASEIVLREEGDHLHLHETTGSSRRWNAAGLLALVPSISLFDPERRHSPRVTVDRLVLSREQWRIPVEELSFAFQGTSLARWLGLRRWARRTKIPRLTFYKMRSEPKPMYLDLDAPRYVDLFCKLLRAEDPAQSITLTEMLPSPEQCWLTDAKGKRYTSELRLVVRDRCPAADAQRGLGSEGG